ncbi:flavonoid 3'-monooxygenase-like [Dendrobium catenatum]|uniref:flavonoid 3'-monooxygenase-like n=1 Tax=Dendrobium catenatum TaxID=906689 RepID=UPI0009F3C67F|nr:flavonoid 3'-monooxygenase-like [Dendrobium catenatum]
MAVLILFLLFFISILFLLSSLFLTGDDRRRHLPLPPGPKGWPLLGNLLQLNSKPHQTLQTLSRSHGSNGLLHLRLGTTTVIIISSSSAASKCFRNHDVNLSSRPPNSIGKHIAYNFQDLVMAPYGLRWRMLRKLFSAHLFSNKALNDFQYVRDEEVMRLVRDLAKRETTVVDIGEMVNSCVVNALARMIVGRRMIVEGEEATKFKEMATEMTRLAGQFNVGDFLPWIDWLDLQGLNKKMKKSREKFGEFLEKIIVEHKLKAEDDKFNGSSRVKDFLSLLIEMNEDVDDQVEQDKLTNINIKALLQDIFIAGTDTTSITIEWILAELIRHPHILARAKQELDSIVGLNRLISELDLPKFSFLHDIIKENFRLHPTVPLSVPRMAIKDCEIDGYLIPKGATLFVNIWAIGRDPVSWPNDPLEFNPDRFGPGSLHENVDVKGNDFELIPFGAGRRICAGMNLGLRMVPLVTAVLVHSFDWKLLDGQMANMIDMEESYGVTMQKARPLMAKAVPRLQPEAYI